MKKFRMLIMTPIDLPVPNVRGGAFTTLAFDIIKKNEERGFFYIDVISRYDADAEKMTLGYSNSRFFYIDINEYREEKYYNSKFLSFLNKIFYKTEGRILIAPPRMRDAYRIINKNEYDCIFALGGKLEEYGKLSRKYGRGKMIFNVGGHLKGGKIAANTFKHFICCSDFISNYLRQDSYCRMCNIHTILNRIDTKRFMQKLMPDERENLIKKFNLQNKKIILFVGRITQEKGVVPLLEAFSKMKYKESCILILAGSPRFGYSGTSAYDKEVKAKINMVDNIRMLGFVHHNELWKIMKICSFAVLPSVWEEPAGNVVPECMAAGLPTIITNSGGMAEYVDETTSIIVPKEKNLIKGLAKAMETLCSNDEKCKQMGKSAENKAKNWDIEVYYDLLVDFLKENICKREIKAY